MPTEKWFQENPKISAYVSPALYLELEEWMRQRNIRKVSQAITTILEEYLASEQAINPSQSSDNAERLEALEDKVEELAVQLSEEIRQVKELLTRPLQNSKPKQLSIPVSSFNVTYPLH